MELEKKIYSSLHLESGAFYKNIKSVSFNPLVKLETMNVAIKKGGFYFWRFLGIIPLIPIYATKDLYKVNWGDSFNRYQTLKKAFAKNYKYGYDIFLNEKEKAVYRMARVNIDCIEKGQSTHKTFKTNEEAMRYFNDIKNKCKEYGNELK